MFPNATVIDFSKSPFCLADDSENLRQAQELLSSIATLETAVTKLEQEMMSLNFQLSQERNERRLAEYHLTHSASPPVCISFVIHHCLCFF